MCLILDTGCSGCISGNRNDFKPLKPIPDPIRVRGIAGGLDITEGGLFQCQVLTDTHEVKTIETFRYFHPELGYCRLMSPQSYFDFNKSET